MQRRVNLLLAVGAEHPDQTLGDHCRKRRIEPVGLQTHVEDSPDRLGPAVGVQRREDKVAGQRALYARLQRLKVADLPDHDHVRVLAENVLQGAGVCQPAAGVDLHLPEAFEAVLHDIDDRGGTERILCLGDIVGYGPNPRECIELLRLYDHVCVAGNHDWVALGKVNLDDFNPDAAAASLWTMEQLGP